MTPIKVGTIVWKKACLPESVEYFSATGRGRCLSTEYALVELQVVEDGFVADKEDQYESYNYSRKGRVRSVQVLSITDYRGEPVEVALSAHRVYDGKTFEYRVGQLITPEEPFDERNVACASGIHCFTERWRAEQYEF